MTEADGYVFVKGCDSCPLRGGGAYEDSFCAHPSAGDITPINFPEDKAHPDCPLRKHSLHIALEPTA